MRRLPIRIRLTLGFALAVTLVLGIAGLVGYARLRDTLDRSLSTSLTSQAGALELVAQRTPAQLGGVLRDRGETPAQILSTGGRVLAATPSLQHARLLTPAQLGRAATRSVSLSRVSNSTVKQPQRVLAEPLDEGAATRILVVTASLAGRDRTLASLRSELLFGVPLAALVTTLLGYVLSTLALRPVTRLGRQVESIDAPGVRVGAPPARDEIARLAATLNSMLARLDAASERERQFVDDASHELRTPLAIIKAELEIALRTPLSRDGYEQVIVDTAREVDGLAQLADDLLLLARSDRAELPHRVESIEPEELVTRVAQRYAQRAANERRELLIESTAPALQGDPSRLEQALGNLVENALRYGEGATTIVSYRHGVGTRIGVRDQGAGIPESFMSEAFQRFTRGDRARETQGAGLGLAIVEVIARAHGGSVYAERPPGGFEAGIHIPDAHAT
jgi:two-component system OmpR family sensor kinase